MQNYDVPPLPARLGAAAVATATTVATTTTTAAAATAAGPLAAPDGPLQRIAGEHHATPSQLALAWLLKRSPVILPIPGTSKVAHLEENVAAASVALDAGEIADAKTVTGLLVVERRLRNGDLVAGA